MEVAHDPALPAWMLLVVLRDVVGCPDLGRFEKVAFECTLTFEDVSVNVALQKFGVRVYLAVADEEQAQQLTARLLKAISSAIPIVEKHILIPQAESQLKDGLVTLDNRWSWYREMYEYFRNRHDELAQRARTTTEPPPERLETASGSGWSYSNLRGELRRQAEFDGIAAITAFFSLLEHLLVIALALSHFDPASEEFNRFVGLSWRDKCRRVLDIDADVEAKKHYDALSRVADDLRNPNAHGGFDRQQSQIFVHMPGVGAIPANLTGAREPPTYFFAATGDSRIEEAWRVLDATDDWLGTGPLRFARRLAESNVDISFDPDTRARLEAAAANDDGSFDDLVHAIGEWQDRATNMDW